MRDARQAGQANCHVFAYLSSVLQPFFLHPVELASETATSPATRQGMFFQNRRRPNVLRAKIPAEYL